MCSLSVCVCVCGKGLHVGLELFIVAISLISVRGGGRGGYVVKFAPLAIFDCISVQHEFFKLFLAPFGCTLVCEGDRLQ